MSCDSVAIQQGYEYGSKGIFVVENRYQASTSEEIEDLKCAVVTVIFRVSEPITCTYEL
jgi:hypothetical protein